MKKYTYFQLFNVNFIFDHLLKGKNKILLTLHPDADLDSLCSNYVFKVMLEHYSNVIGKPIKVHLIGGDNFDPNDFEGFEFMTNEVIRKNYKEYTKDNVFDILIALDIPRVGRISKFLSQEEFEKLDVIVIDHHASNCFVETEKCVVFLDKNASSTSEIIAEIIINYKALQASKYTLYALYLGIWSDTRGFNPVSSRALEILSWIKNYYGKRFSEEIDILIQKRTKTWTTSDYKLLIEAIRDHYVFEYCIDENSFNVSICIYDNSLDIFKVLDVLSKSKSELLIVAQKSTEKGYYWIEILSWLPEKYEIAKEIAIQFDGGGHANRAGGKAHQSLTHKQLRGKILYKLGVILNNVK